MRRALVLVVLIAACATRLPEEDGDGGALSTPDLAGASTCDVLAASINHWMTSHTACTVDSDCTKLYTDCGLDGQCGMFVNQLASGGDFPQLMSQWRASCEMHSLCSCPAQPPQAACVEGVCTAKVTLAIVIGAPCTSDASCGDPRALCLHDTDGVSWKDGYCTLACEVGDGTCPSGSRCMQASRGASLCLADCNPFQNSLQCRDGYLCCWGGGPPTVNNAGCAASLSQTCLAN